MKARNFISVVLSITVITAMLLSFAIVSQAATVPAASTNAEIYVNGATVVDGYWVVTYGFKSDDTLGITTASRRSNGIGICSIECTLNILAVDDPIYAVTVNDGVSTAASTGNNAGYYKFSWVNITAPARAIVANPIITVETNYEETDKTEAEIIDMFSDLKKTVITLAYLNDYNAAAYSDDLMVSYGVGDDGVTKYVDSDYVLITPASSTPEPSVDTFTATTTLGNGGDAVKSQNPGGVEYGSAFRIAFTRPAAATSDDAIFGVTAGSAKKYSPKQVDILKGLTGDITMDVSFLNGREGSISPQKIDAVSVILANAEGTQFFYSDAEDASNKSK